MKTFFKKAFITTLSAAVLVIGSFSVCYLLKANRDNSTLGRTETEFTADESGNRISNIPFQNYITKIKKPKNAVTAEVSPDASGESNSKAINNAINSLKDGGVVYIPKGEYKVSTINLKSNTTLFVSKDAILVSLNCEENEKSESPLKSAVISAENAENILITGGGTICGEGESYTQEPKETKPLYALEHFNLYTRVIEARKRIRFAKGTERNHIICLNGCKNARVENIVLKDAANWTLVIKKSSFVTVENLVIDNNMHVANTDGIDICASSDVKIENCFIATGDDAVVLKSSEGEIHNIEVKNCILSSFANCFKIGTETKYDVNNVSVSSCKFFMPSGITGGYSGISVESADGANVSDIKIKDIEMDGVSSPILIWLGNRFKYDKKEVGSIKNILVENVNATNTELPSAVTGCEYEGKIYHVQNVTLKNINTVYRDTKENLKVKKNVSDYSMSGYPEITRVSHIYFLSNEFSSYWDLPCYSLFIRHAQNIDYATYKTEKRKSSKLQEMYLENVN